MTAAVAEKTRVRKPAAARKAEPKVETPEVDLSAYLNKEPSEINKAEAEWLASCVGLDLTSEQLKLAQKIVQLVAGSAHRNWQASVVAKALHAKKA